jgi:hypothetical protein
VFQPEDAAAVDADQIGELLQRDWLGRRGDRFEDRQAAVETLDRRGVVEGFAVHGSVLRSRIPRNRRAISGVET